MDSISVTFEQGIFRPLVPVSLPEGSRAEVFVVANELPADQSNGVTSMDAQTIEQQLRELAAQAPLAEWQKLPGDLTDRLDHYLYGAAE